MMRRVKAHFFPFGFAIAAGFPPLFSPSSSSSSSSSAAVALVLGRCCFLLAVGGSGSATVANSAVVAAAATVNNNVNHQDDENENDNAAADDTATTCTDPTGMYDINNGDSENDVEKDFDNEDDYDNDGCTLYLAESTIPGAGLGIFSAVERHAGEPIGSPGGDVCIPVIDSWWHNLVKATTTTNNDTDEGEHHLHNPFSDYFWQGQAMGMLSEAASGDVEAFCPGLDCAVNCHLGLVNVMKSIPDNDGGMCIHDSNNSNGHSNNMIHRSTHATAGSFTPYYNGTTIVSRRIPSGGELFKFYGDSWFTSRQETFGYIPLSEDYEDAELILHKFVQVSSTQFLQKQKAEKEQKEKSKRKVWSKLATATTTNNATKNNQTKAVSISALQQDLYNLVLSIRDSQETSRILNALPDKLQDALWAAEEQDMSVILQEQHRRPVEWLRQHGRCLDHIQGKTSTLTIAPSIDGGDSGGGVGRGAFARRWIRKGQVITTSPLHHLPHGVVGSRRNDGSYSSSINKKHYYNHSFVSMYNITLRQRKDEGGDSAEAAGDGAPFFVRILDSGVRQQLMVNYCYSHRDTTMLLCPYGTGVHYLNHAPLIPGNNDDDAYSITANVALRWARNFPIAHNHGLLYHLSLEQLEQPEYGKPLFAMDYVALRDIEPGEELFLNYGVDWQEAWDAHVQKWNASIETKWQEYRHYHPAAYWNRFFGGDLDSVLRTTDEQQVDPYPSNIDLRCHFHLAKGTSKTNYTWKPNEMGFPCQILDRFVENNTIWYTADVEVRSTNLNGVPSMDDDDLDIHEAETSSSSTLSPESTSTRSSHSSSKTRVTRVLRTDLPRRAFRFFDKPGTTDIHLPEGSFRHWIGIPDEMVPPQWKNLI